MCTTGCSPQETGSDGSSGRKSEGTLSGQDIFLHDAARDVRTGGFLRKYPMKITRRGRLGSIGSLRRGKA